MAYQKTNWTNTTPINTSNLNKIEQGIYDTDEAINKVKKYSSQEQKIGTSIDGKPLYRKTLSFNTTVNSETPLYIAHNISNVDTIFVDYSYSYLWNDTTGSYSLPIVGYDGGFTDTVYCMANENNIVICSTGGWNALWTKVITVNYTKTTD